MGTPNVDGCIFQKGDFIKMDRQSMEFAIFEGNVVKISKTTCRIEYSLIAYYKENKVVWVDDKHCVREPYLDVSCKTTVSSILIKCFKKMDDNEKKEALDILNSYGYEWDDENLSLVNKKNKITVSQTKPYNNDVNNKGVRDIYKKGDFIRMGKSDFEFGIFEGNELFNDGHLSTNKYSLLAYYKKNKFVKKDNGIWVQMPYFETSEGGKPCEQSMSQCLLEFYSKMSETEKAQAIEVLHTYGYDWNEETLSVVKLERVATNIAVSYNGTVVKPMKRATIVKLRAALKKCNYSEKKGNVYIYNRVNGKFELVD